MSFKTYVAPIVTSEKPLTAMEVAAAVAIEEGLARQLQLELTPPAPEPSPDFTITSSAPGVAIAGVTHNNMLSILGLSAGNTDITITDGAVSKTVSVTVSPPSAPNPVVFPQRQDIPATAIAITASTKTLTTLQQFDLSAIVTPYNFNQNSVQWASSDATVADVADISYIEHRTGIYRGGHTATVRGMKPGTATITATIGAFSASCVVTVV